MLTEFDSEAFDDFVFDRMSETKLPSVACSIVKDGELVHSRGYGFKDVSARLPASQTTLYGVGSITKSFTALSVAKLVDGGEVDFHDPVTKFLPLKAKAFEGVEIHHLLTHSSGLPTLGYAEAMIYGAIREYHQWLPLSSMGDMASFLSDVDKWVEARPGERVSYSNEGFFLLGEIISMVSGRQYERFVSDEIFSPLRMKRSFFAKEQISADPDVATPYAIRNGEVSPSPIPYGVGAAGGIVSNVVDLSNYIMMYINRGEFEGKQIVGRETLEKMEKPHAKCPIEYYSGDSYGYGLRIITDFHGHKVVMHGGSVDVYTSNFNYVPDARAGSVLLANGKGYNMRTLGMVAVALALGEDPEDLEPVKMELLLKRLEGQYRTYKDTIFVEVKRAGSFLTLSSPDTGTAMVLVPERYDADGATFFSLDDDARMEVQFRFNKHGVELFYPNFNCRRVGPL